MNPRLKSLLSLAVLAGASSFAAAEDKVCFYEHPEYTGAEWCYSPGNVGWIGSSRNDKISSIKTYGNAYAEIFEHGSYGGKRTNIMGNTYKMDDLNDGISSFKVKLRANNDFVCLFEHPGFRGTPHCLTAGQSEDDMNHVAQGRNNASSITVSGNAAATIYEYPGFRTDKKYTTLNRSSSNLDKRPGSWVEDNIDSFKVISQAPSSTEAAIDINESLAAKAPIRQASILASHNAFNSTAYFGGQAIPGPNHRRALIEQLQLGVRFFELDVRGGGDKTKVCHSVDCNFSSFTTSLRRMLGEVDTWLKGADDNDAVFFFLQDDMDGNNDGYRQLQKDVAWMGDIVYSAGSCQNLPKPFKLDDMIAQGKRVFFYKSGGSNGCSLAPSVHVNFETNIGVAGINIHQNHFNKDRLLRSQECHNNFCNDVISGPDAKIGLENGVNGFGLDMLEESSIDNQGAPLNAQLWAIGPEDTYSAYANGRTVRFTVSGDRYMKLAWNSQKQFACRLTNGDWAVTTATGNVWDGGSKCSAEFPGSRYDVPLSAYEAKKLRAKLTSGSDIHVNFGTSNGRWVPGRWGALADR